jgi:hypothetical protein
MLLLAFEDVVMVLISGKTYTNASRRAGDSPGYHFQFL